MRRDRRPSAQRKAQWAKEAEYSSKLFSCHEKKGKKAGFSRIGAWIAPQSAAARASTGNLPGKQTTPSGRHPHEHRATHNDKFDHRRVLTGREHVVDAHARGDCGRDARY
jgi:hypothetical protein